MYFQVAQLLSHNFRADNRNFVRPNGQVFNSAHFGGNLIDVAMETFGQSESVVETGGPLAATLRRLVTHGCDLLQTSVHV